MKDEELELRLREELRRRIVRASPPIGCSRTLRAWASTSRPRRRRRRGSRPDSASAWASWAAWPLPRA